MVAIRHANGFTAQPTTPCGCGDGSCGCGMIENATTDAAPSAQADVTTYAGPVSPTRAQEITFLNGLNPDGTLASGGATYWTFNNSTASAHRWPNAGGGTTPGTGATITYAFDQASAFTATEQDTVLRAFDMWSSVCNVTFTAAASQAAANVVIERGSDGGASESGPYTRGSGSTPGRNSGQATISIDTSVPSFSLSAGLDSRGGYGQSTIIHEVGHLLGLGHGGLYNGSVTPSTQQYSAYDDRLWTIMSYISWRNTDGRYRDSYPVTGTNWGSTADGYYRSSPFTVGQLDIQAAQQLYGAPTATPFSGGQTYGFHSNITGRLALQYDFTRDTSPVVTLYNQGLDNTLDLSGFSSAATVNLNDGAFSSFAGLTNNLSIAVGTRIDNFVGGPGTNTIVGNAYANLFTITTGTDTIDGGAGLDTVAYGVARAAVTVALVGNGVYAVTGSGYNDTLTSIERLRFTDQTIDLIVDEPLVAASDLNGDGTGDLVLQAGGSVADWIMGNGQYRSGNLITQAAAGYTVVGAGDLNGDGTGDLVLQNGGTVVDWIMGGGRYQAGNVLTSNAGGYDVRAVGDVNGDGTADLVLQNGGSVAVWTMQDGRYQSGRIVGTGVDGYTVVGAGDFDGDGDADLLLRNGGTVIEWVMQGGAYQSGRVLTNAAGGFTIVGIGDFNGDTQDDILLQSGGTVVDWIMGGGQYQYGNTITTSAAGYTVRAAGDFNGDRTDDIALQAGAGSVVQWTMRNGVYASGNGVGVGASFTIV